MAAGWGNPKDGINSTTVRPSETNGGAGVRKWFSSGLRTRVWDQDLNRILAVLRDAADTYGVTDQEGTDNILTAVFAKHQLIADLGTQTTGGTANAQTIGASPNITSYTNGIALAFKSGFTNTAAATLSVNSIGPKAFRKIAPGGDVALSPGDLRLGGMFYAIYSDTANSSSGGFVLLNPATTISRTQHFFHVDDYGAVGNGSTDDFAAIQAAYAAAGAASGTLVFGPKVYGIADDLIFDSHNVFVQGAGNSWATNKNGSNINQFIQFGGTVLRALAGCTNMVTFRPVYDNVTGTRIVGGGMDGIVLECNAIAEKGLVIESMAGGWFPHVTVNNPVSIGVHLTVTDEENLPDINRVGGIGPTGTGEEPRDTQHCLFGKILTRTWLAGAQSAKGIVLDGDDEADVSWCQFESIFFIHHSAVGLELNSSDGCRFGFVSGFRLPGGSGGGIQINGGASVTDFPRHHYFDFCQPGDGGFNVTANTVKPDNICIGFYSRGNGTPAVTYDDGCRPKIVKQSNGFEAVIVHDPNGRTLTANDMGALWSNSGATGRADFTLLTAAEGYRVGFTCSDADGIRVVAASGDTIRLGTSASAGRIDSVDIGSTVWLTAIDSTEWRAESVTGTWTVT